MEILKIFPKNSIYFFNFRTTMGGYSPTLDLGKTKHFQKNPKNLVDNQSSDSPSRYLMQTDIPFIDQQTCR